MVAKDKVPCLFQCTILLNQMIGKWVMGDVDAFLRTLSSNLPPTENGDCMRWKLSKNGNFTVHSFYNKLRGPVPIIFPWKSVWKVKAPRRVSFFVF